MERILHIVRSLQNWTLPINLIQHIKVNLLALQTLALIILFFWMNHSFGKVEIVHLGFSAGIFILYFCSAQTRIFLILAFPIILKSIIYDNLRYIPFEWLPSIHIIEPYVFDKLIFGVNINGTVMLLHEYLLSFAHPVWDFSLSIVYFFFEPIMYIFVLLFWKLKSASLAGRFSIAFLLLNLFAFVTYFLYPTAPPWYISEYGFSQPLLPIPGDAAGLLKLDSMLGINFYNTIYEYIAVVFGAIPSIHVAVPTLAWLYAMKVNKKLAWISGGFTLATGIAALYLQHHYLIDLILGVFYALVTFFLIETLFGGFINKTYQAVFRLYHEFGGWTLFENSRTDPYLSSHQANEKMIRNKKTPNGRIPYLQK